MKIGYARVSTQDQNLDRQLDQLKAAGCEKIYQEKITGTKKDRLELNKMLEDIRTNDIVVIAELTRLGRSTRDLIDLSELISKKGAELVSLKESLDTTTATGKAMFGMLTVMAQFERDIISERTKQGLASAKARGRNGGRPNKQNDKSKTVETLYKNGFKITKIAEETQLSRATIYRILNKDIIEDIPIVKTREDVTKIIEKLKDRKPNKSIRTFFKS